MTIQSNVVKMKEQIGKVIMGKGETIELLMNAFINQGHVLLESVPGTGKTMLAKAVAKSVEGDFQRIQFTPDVLPSDVSGIQYFNPKDQQFELRVGPVLTNVLLADEINRATPRTQSSLLEVMEEKQVTIDGETVNIPQPFIVIATQNPVESQQGTFDLPEAQMDRFFMKLDLGYPSYADEKTMMQSHRENEPLEQLTSIFSKEDLVGFQNEVKKVKVTEVVEEYILDIVQATRNHQYVDVGVSPRGTLAFMRSAQGCAAIKGRDYVTPEDVKEMAPYVLPHRLVLSLDGSTIKSQEDVLTEALEEVEVPAEYGVAK
ncbi:AAA family ATPase [Alkalibacillus haloalkaliphilus]|uniref:AAA family ATPase n=1 Tax=Alkalibacillus haloalkaliphilus TaxID=94136 RepID=UPI0002F45241|nr:MoxR family ATPase [Alkalibacillus haloalkaliphilus]